MTDVDAPYAARAMEAFGRALGSMFRELVKAGMTREEALKVVIEYVGKMAGKSGGGAE